VSGCLTTGEEPFGVEVTHQGATTTAAVAGELDLATAPELLAAVEGLVALGRTRIVVDLAGLGFCDSSGLDALVRSLEAARVAGGCLALRAPQPPVARLLELSGLARLVPVQP
jgi:anti-anti-sigma factor